MYCRDGQRFQQSVAIFFAKSYNNLSKFVKKIYTKISCYAVMIQMEEAIHVYTVHIAYTVIAL